MKYDFYDDSCPCMGLFGIKKPKWIENIQKALHPGGSLGKALTSFDKTRLKVINTMVDFTAPGIIYDLATKQENVAVTGFKNITEGWSMNKIIDSLTPDVVLPPEEESPIKKYLPVLLIAAGSIPFLMGE